MRETLSEQLSREIREYLDDFRELLQAIASAEGLIALFMVLAVIAVSVAWFIVGLGFDRLNSAIGAAWRPFYCGPLSDKSAIILFTDFIVMVLLSVTTLGETLRLFDRMRNNRPPKVMDIVTPSGMLLLAGLGGIVYMRTIC